MRFRNASGERIRLESGARMNDDECCCGCCSFTYSNTGCDFEFTFTGSCGTTFLWDFGDGTTSTSENPTHTFPAEGPTYTVTLTVDGTDTCQQDITCGSAETCDKCTNGLGDEALIIVSGVDSGVITTCDAKCEAIDGAIVVDMVGCFGTLSVPDGSCVVCPGVSRSVFRVYKVGVKTSGSDVVIEAEVQLFYNADGSDPGYCSGDAGAVYQKTITGNPVECRGTHTLDKVSSVEYTCSFPDTVMVVL